MNGPIRRAEPERGDLLGTITGAKNVPLPGVNVSILNLKTNKVSKTDTDEDGKFLVSNLEVGSYRLTASLVGYSDIRKDVRINPNQPVNLKLTMKTLKPKPNNKGKG